MSAGNCERGGNAHIFSVVELEQEDGGEKSISDEHLFSSRDGGLGFLRRRYEETKRRAKAGAGVFSEDYSDDGWFQVVDADGCLREGYLSEGMQPDGQEPTGPERSLSEILEELETEFVRYDADRDEEWEFADKHGLDDTTWTDEQREHHGLLIEGIREGYARLMALFGEAAKASGIGGGSPADAGETVGKETQWKNGQAKSIG